ncbi:MAG TPA: DNA-processing protein DprA, partial [Patescibacteria group bacterium]|nr:DNA-processing protein DprA [Patescibacteria group bacterium]
GNTDFNSPSFGIVGTRRITNYGREVTEILASELSYKFTIVSGMALGVDAQAHRSAISAGGKTIAFLGYGVDCPTPLENEGLYI